MNRIHASVLLCGVLCAASLAGATASAQPALTRETPQRVFVTNLEDSSVSVVDFNTLKELSRLHVGPRPYYPALSGDQKILAVTVEGEESIKFYDLPGMTERGTLHVGKMYSDHMMALPDGKRLIISDRYGNAVLLVDIATMQIQKRIPGVMQPHNIRLGNSGHFAYVTTKVDPAITVVDLDSGTIRTQFHMKFIPRGIAVSNDEKKIYCGANWVNAIYEYDAFTGKLLRVLPTAPPANVPVVQESTYHGLEFLNDSLLLATNEGNSTLDVINVKSWKMVDRTTKVANPGAILQIPNQPGKFLFTNMGDNTIVYAEASSTGKITLLKSGKTGHKVGELPKRFVFAGK